MVQVKRYKQNPVLVANKSNSWEAVAVFNGSLVKHNDYKHLVYRAVSSPQVYLGQNMQLSTIGHAVSNDGIHFEDRELFIYPEHEWEKFGCEDPRVTKLDGKYYIFYTALSDFPHTSSGIKVGVAITRDFKSIEEKHQVTYFNSKAMALFPEKINNKFAAVVTVNTDNPPAKIALALFDKESDIWSKDYWDNWLKNLDKHVITLQKDEKDHVEAGAAPIKTDQGWLFIYSYIKNFFTPPPTFAIEAVLLDLKNPQKIIARTPEPLLVPSEEYELQGMVPNVIFPSGAVKDKKNLKIYYGAADSSVCFAEVEMDELLSEMFAKGREPVALQRFKGNPIIKPIPGSSWESKYTLNAAAVYEGGKVHIVYRAMNEKDVSSFGYASSSDGVHINERLTEPIYTSREDVEKKIQPIYHNCEDPRITKIGDRFYMCYTAFDGKTPTVVALTSIKVSDFLDKKWNWKTPKIISDPTISDKNACVFPEKIKGKYAFLHRLEHRIWLDYFDDLEFEPGWWLHGKAILNPREGKWDSEKIGIAGVPIKTSKGWLMIYHGLSQYDKKYRLGAVLLDLENPDKILSRLDYPIIEPKENYEHEGFRPGTIFSCGSVVIKSKLFVYYGAADQVVCVAHMEFDELLEALTLQINA